MNIKTLMRMSSYFLSTLPFFPKLVHRYPIKKDTLTILIAFLVIMYPKRAVNVT